MTSPQHTITDLLAIMQRLRRECAWDKKQTPRSLTPYAIEEAYEVEAAIRSEPQHLSHIQEELGDLLLQVIFQAQMFSEQGAFDFADVVDGLCHKLIRRHPHVFQPNYADLDAEQVSELWAEIKRQERADQPPSLSILDKVKPTAALQQAQQLQQVAAQVKFDWADVWDARRKLDEEIAELDQAIAIGNADHISAELGDCFFSLVNVARKLNIDADQSLRSTNDKFKRRFGFIEAALQHRGLSLEQCSMAQLDELWEVAKRQEG